MNPKNATNNLAIIGASGTGKTTLAVGLYATSTKAFTVSPIGDETRKYLEIRQTSIQEGFWPAATNESENFDLRLGLHAAGRRTDIVFREYMGERMERDPNYIREVIGKPKSAMILFNPGMPGLEKPEARNRMIGNLKKIAQHLKDNRCIAVAFVVTASDRLSSDLKDFREDFEAYASEVTNHLTNLRLNWKRFDVTVSGQLEDQNKPKLARGENNTTHEPFLWLLSSIKHHEFWLRVKVSAATAAVLLAVAGAAFGGFVWSSRSKLAGAEASLGKCLGALNASYASYDEAAIRTNAKFLETNAFERLSAILPSDRVRKDKVVAQAKEQRDLWNVRLLAMEFELTSKKLKEKPSDVQLGWFRDFDGKLTATSPSFTNAVAKRGELADAWEKSRKAMETVCQTAHFRNEVERESKNLASAKEKSLVEPLKASFLLLMDTGDRYALVTNRSELSAPLLPARTSAIARYVDSETDWEPTDPNPPGDAKDLIRKIRQELKSALSSDEFANLETIVEQRRNEARIAWEKHQFPRRRQAQLDELKAASDSPAVALKDSHTFLGDIDRLFPSIPETDRVSARASITNERALAIGRYIDSKTRWKPEDDDPPGSVGELHLQARTDLKGALTTVEFDSLESKLTQRRDKARSEWDAYHFPKRLSELETALKGAGTSPARPLKESLAFLGSMTNDYPTISQADFIRTRMSLAQARNAALAAYGKSIADKWDVNGRKPPEFDGKKIRDTILTDAVVTDAEASAFSHDMEKRFAVATEKWRAKQAQLVADFSVTGDPEVLVRNFGEFFDEHSNNPYLDNLAEKVDSALQTYFREFIGNYYADDMKETERRFFKFRSVCSALTGKGLAGNSIQNFPSFKFAKLCCDEGKLNDTSRGIYSVFEERLRITKIEAFVRLSKCSDSYHGLDMGIEVGALRWNFTQNNPEVVPPSRIIHMKEAKNSNGYGRIPRNSNNSWQTIWNGDADVSYNPYVFPILSIDFEDRLGGVISDDVPGSAVLSLFEFDESRGASTKELEETEFSLYHAIYESTEGILKVRVTASRIGKNFKDLAREAGLIR